MDALLNDKQTGIHLDDLTSLNHHMTLGSIYLRFYKKYQELGTNTAHTTVSIAFKVTSSSWSTTAEVYHGHIQ